MKLENGCEILDHYCYHMPSTQLRGVKKEMNLIIMPCASSLQTITGASEAECYHGEHHGRVSEFAYAATPRVRSFFAQWTVVQSGLLEIAEHTGAEKVF
jgi:hypothetical protein